jgi:cytochrome c-type biogenesis protein CcmE
VSSGLVPDGVTGASRRTTRLRLLIGLAVVVGALTWVTVRGLTGSFVYYLTPTDIVSQHKAQVGERVRLGGYVVPGSVGRATDTLTFTVTDGTDSIPVSDVGSVPELFKPGQGVVLEGSVGTDGRFHSDTLLIKHSGEYRPPAPGQKPPNSADLGSGG